LISSSPLSRSSRLSPKGRGSKATRAQPAPYYRAEPEGVERWYLRAIDIIAKGNRVGTVSIEGLDWQEVDFPQDVEAAGALTAKWVVERRYAK